MQRSTSTILFPLCVESNDQTRLKNKIEIDWQLSEERGIAGLREKVKGLSKQKKQQENKLIDTNNIMWLLEGKTG